MKNILIILGVCVCIYLMYRIEKSRHNSDPRKSKTMFISGLLGSILPLLIGLVLVILYLIFNR